MIKRIFTVLISGNKVAYFGALTLLLTPISKIVDKSFAVFLRHRVQKYSGPIPPFLFITGTPRSGTTVIYQTLVQFIPCVYITNWHAIMPHVATSMLRKSSEKFSSTRNYYGHTYGWAGVNEGNSVLNNIYGDGKDKERIRRKFLEFVSLMQGNKKTPIIVKNVLFYDKLHILMEVNPEIKVLQIDRDLLQTSQSVIKAYRELGHFAPVPSALEGKQSALGPYRFAVRMLKEVQRSLGEQKSRTGDDRWYKISYEEFCKSPELYAKNILRFLDLTDVTLNPVNIRLNALNRQKVNDEELKMLKDAFNSGQNRSQKIA